MFKKLSGIACMISACAISACEPDLVDDPIPFDTFAPFTVNITSYTELASPEGSKDLGGDPNYGQYGVRGIILYRKSATEILAFEKNCSFQPREACSTVGIDQSKLYMRDDCCGSTFNFEGKPTGGLAWRPLLQYHTSLSGQILTISDAILD